LAVPSVPGSGLPRKPGHPQGQLVCPYTAFAQPPMLGRLRQVPVADPSGCMGVCSMLLRFRGGMRAACLEHSRLFKVDLFEAFLVPPLPCDRARRCTSGWVYSIRFSMPQNFSLILPRRSDRFAVSSGVFAFAPCSKACAMRTLADPRFCQYG
jgi:hypothetical protein